MHTIKPIDKGLIKKLKKIKKVITVEEHNIIGGLDLQYVSFYKKITYKYLLKELELEINIQNLAAMNI